MSKKVILGKMRLQLDLKEEQDLGGCGEGVREPQ